MAPVSSPCTERLYAVRLFSLHLFVHILIPGHTQKKPLRKSMTICFSRAIITLGAYRQECISSLKNLRRPPSPLSSALMIKNASLLLAIKRLKKRCLLYLQKRQWLVDTFIPTWSHHIRLSQCNMIPQYDPFSSLGYTGYVVSDKGIRQRPSTH